MLSQRTVVAPGGRLQPRVSVRSVVLHMLASQVLSTTRRDCSPLQVAGVRAAPYSQELQRPVSCGQSAGELQPTQPTPSLQTVGGMQPTPPQTPLGSQMSFEVQGSPSSQSRSGTGVFTQVPPSQLSSVQGLPSSHASWPAPGKHPPSTQPSPMVQGSASVH